jgi:predicted ABC-type ATPase
MPSALICRGHFLFLLCLVAIPTVWQHLGYQVKLWFLSLPNEDIAVSRVALRVLQGGHNIPEDIIRRRFKAGLENFHKRYSKVVDSWAFFDNYGIEPKLIDWSSNEP